MKHVSKRDTIWTYIKPYFWVSKGLGLANFSIDGDIRNGKIRTGFLDVTYFVVILGGQVYACFLNLTNDISLSRTNSVLIDGGARLIGVFNAFNVLVATFMFFLNRKKIWKIFRMLYEVDNEVSSQLADFGI